MDAQTRGQIEDELNQIVAAVTSRGLSGWEGRREEHEARLAHLLRGRGVCFDEAVAELMAIPNREFDSTGKMGMGEAEVARAVGRIRDCIDRLANEDTPH
jgi:hypothetical protein